MNIRRLALGARFVRACIVYVLLGAAAAEVFAAAIIIDNFSGTKQFGARSFASSQGGGMGTAPTFGESGGWGTVTLTPVNSIVSGTLTYTAAAPFDLTGGGTNSQFLTEFVGVTTQNPTGFTQVANLQITIRTTGGNFQKSGIGIGEGQVNQAIPFSSFTGSGNLGQVTSIDLAYFSVSNTLDGSIIMDRIWVSPLAGAVPTPPGASFAPVACSPIAGEVHFTLSFSNNQGAAPIMGLTAGDLTLSGTAGATTVTVNGTVGSSYDIAITGMTADGTVGISLGAGTVSDLWQQTNPSGASSTVSYVKPPVFTNGPPPSSVVYGTAYGPFTYTATGKVPITYAIASGSLPAPMTLSAGGALSGTPTALGNFTGVTRATNVCSTDQAFSITVTCPVITVSPATLPNPSEFAAYSQALTAAGVPGTYTFAVTSGALPAGMSLSAAGVLSGPATATGPATFVVTATGPAGFACSGARSYSITVRPTLDIDGSITATRYDALTDGVLAIRYMLNLTGTSLGGSVLGGTAIRNSTTVKTYLDANRLAYDIDGDGFVDPQTDGLLILRYLFGLRGAALIQNAFVPGSPRSTAPLIEQYLGGLTP